MQGLICWSLLDHSVPGTLNSCDLVVHCDDIAPVRGSVESVGPENFRVLPSGIFPALAHHNWDVLFTCIS